MKVISIVVTYNRKELLKECIESLKAQKNAKTDILVIDNNSNDGTEEMIKENFSDVIYENTHANLGGAGGFNYGLKKALKLDKDYDYFWLMDDDTIPNLDVLEKLLNAAKEDENFGFISVKTVWKDGALCKMNCQTISIDKKKMVENTTENMTKIAISTFVSCLINRKAIIDIGLPIKEFFIWSDDTEYTMRISHKYNCYYINNCEVVHKMKNNNAANIVYDNLERIDRYYYQFRNRFYIAKQYGIKRTLRYHGFVLKNILLVLLKSKDYKMKRLKYILKGYFAGYSFNPKIEFVER